MNKFSKKKEDFFEYLWETRWYPFVWDITYGPFFKIYSRWKFKHDLKWMFNGKIPTIGDTVCDCRYRHLKIVKLGNNIDDVILEDGSHCSLYHCCHSVPHPDWEHPSEEELEEWRKETEESIRAAGYDVVRDGGSIRVNFDSEGMS